MDVLNTLPKFPGSRPAAVVLSGLTALLTVLLLAVPNPGQAAGTALTGSADAGKTKSVTCAACHGADGNSVNPEWPSLAGQHASYLVKALKTFKSGERKNVLMSGMAMPLTDQDMADLAAYFSEQKLAPGVADPALVAAGERLFRGGDKDTGVPACLACHGPTGHGNEPAAWPAIAGQHAAYAAAQLTAYRQKERTTDGDTQMMRNVASALSDDDIKAVSAYIQGLY
ncbi:MAG: c-type cytochrome [Gammaproteobacteria bacterium]